VADAATEIETAKLHTSRAIADVEQELRTRVQLDLATRARIRMDLGTAARHVNAAVRLLLDAGESSSFALNQPIQQIWRNVEVASRHSHLSYGISREVYAHALLGLEEQVTALL
jgi:alkylation response protein AidB-like acyl-CoA dehydrogenase